MKDAVYKLETRFVPAMQCFLVLNLHTAILTLSFACTKVHSSIEVNSLISGITNCKVKKNKKKRWLYICTKHVTKRNIKSKISKTIADVGKKKKSTTS